MYLRSTKLLPVRSGLQTKVNLLLEEFGAPAKPRMATAAVCQKYDMLRGKAVDILELRKQLEKMDHDLKAIQSRQGTALDDDSVGASARKKDSDVCFSYQEKSYSSEKEAPFIAQGNAKGY